MCALCRSIYNLISLAMLDKDRACVCTCGRNEDFHVVPYTGARFTVDSGKYLFSSVVVTQQAADMMLGLLLGVCICWLLLWVNKASASSLKHRVSDQGKGFGFWSWMPKFITTRGYIRPLSPKKTQESTGDMVHVIQEEESYVDTPNTSDKCQ